MKDSIRAGHNEQCPGASALGVGGLDETRETKLVYPYVISNLQRAGDDTVDSTPGPCSEYEDLNYGTSVSNNAGADVFVPIHFNKAYDSYEGALGSEVWINPSSPTSVRIGTQILNNLAVLGFKNRGLKDGLNGQHLHDINASNMPAILVEVCFCEASEDIKIYKSVGHVAVGVAIAEGILGRSISNISPVIVNPVPNVPVTRVNNSIAQLQAELNAQGFSRLIVDGFYGPKTLGACPLVKLEAVGNLTRWIQKRLGFSTVAQDGDFGPNTQDAVIKFQRVCGLIDDGIVGKNTWAALLR